MRSSLSLPVRIHHCTSAFANLFIVPVPRLRVDKLSHSSNDPQAGQIVTLKPFITQPTKRADGRGCSIKLRDLVLCNQFPVTRGCWICWEGFEEDGSRAQSQGSIDNVSVPCNPADICHARENIAWMVIKHVLECRSGAKHIAPSGVHHSLGRSRRSRGVEEEHGVF